MSHSANGQLSWPDLSEQDSEEIDIFETELNRFLDGQMPDCLLYTTPRPRDRG
mgnify:CR=1 FL=1